MPGVFEVKRMSGLGKIINELALLVEASHENEWEGQIVFIPMT
jgi:hypothetical protein